MSNATRATMSRLRSLAMAGTHSSKCPKRALRLPKPCPQLRQVNAAAAAMVGVGRVAAGEGIGDEGELGGSSVAHRPAPPLPPLPLPLAVAAAEGRVTARSCSRQARSALTASGRPSAATWPQSSSPLPKWKPQTAHTCARVASAASGSCC